MDRGMIDHLLFSLGASACVFTLSVSANFMLQPPPNHSTQWALQIGSFMFVALIKNTLVQRHVVDRNFNRNFAGNILRNPLGGEGVSHSQNQSTFQGWVYGS